MAVAYQAHPETPSRPADSYASVWQESGAVAAAEQRRLGLQADLFGGLAAWTLDALALAPGGSVLEVGCGGGALLAAAAERVGPDGRVVGVERDPRLLAEARERTSPFPWVEIVEADALRHDFGGERFDAVHCRLVLIHQPEPDAFLARMAALARPGGRLAAQEYDAEGLNGAPVLTCFPAFPALERMAAAVFAAVPTVGLDPQAGRKLPARFHRAGLRDLRVESALLQTVVTDPRLRVLLDLWWDRGPVCERAGVMPAAAFDALAAEVRAALGDPRYAHCLVRAFPLIAAAGAKPPAAA